MKLIHRLAVAGAAAMALAAAPAAHADSIAYVKDGNVWLSTSDGARQFQVTTTGGYSDVSQADDGTMIALHGIRLHRLDRQGTVTADFATPVSDDRPIGMKAFWGPYEPTISPSGDKVAYTYYYVSNGAGPDCYPPTCFVAAHEGGTGYSHSDRLTPWDEVAIGRHSGWTHPSWIDNDNTMLSDPTHMPNRDVVLDTVGDGAALLKDWFTDKGTAHVGAGEMTRQKTKMAFVSGAQDEELRIYRVRDYPTTFPPPDGSSQYPEVCYHYTNPNGGKYAAPTWSPDGAHLAFAEGDGVHVVDVPDQSAGCTTSGATDSRLLIPGATEPDWGPADVPPARPAPGDKQDGPNGPVAPAGPVGPVTPQSAPLAATVKATKLRAALRGGLRVRVTAPAGGRIAVALRRGTRKAGGATRRVAAAGDVTLTVRLARRAIGRVHRVTLRLTVTFTPAGGAAQKVTRSVTLR